MVEPLTEDNLELFKACEAPPLFGSQMRAVLGNLVVSQEHRSRGHGPKLIMQLTRQALTRKRSSLLMNEYGVAASCRNACNWAKKKKT